METGSPTRSKLQVELGKRKCMGPRFNEAPSVEAVSAGLWHFSAERMEEQVDAHSMDLLMSVEAWMAALILQRKAKGSEQDTLIGEREVVRREGTLCMDTGQARSPVGSLNTRRIFLLSFPVCHAAAHDLMHHCVSLRPLSSSKPVL